MSNLSRPRTPETIEDRTVPEVEPEEVPTSRRQISLVERVELNLSTSRLSPNAIVLGDIDNDAQKDSEIAIGNGEGDLFIFKGKRKYAWKRAAGLGSISCLALGDLLGTGHNTLVAITTEGRCYLFDVTQHSPSDSSNFKASEAPHPEDKHSLNTVPIGSSRMPPSDSKMGPSIQSSLVLPNVLESKDAGDLYTPEALHATEATMSSSKSSGKLWGLPRADSASILPLKTGTDLPTASSTTTSSTKLNREDAFLTASGHERSASTSAAPLNTYGSLSSGQIPSFSSIVGMHLGDETLGHFEEAGAPHSEPHTTSRATNAWSTQSQSKGGKTERIEPIYRWFVAGNGTCAIVTDVDEDGQSELVIGSSNRVVYSYGIAHETDSIGAVTTKLKLKSKWSVPGQVGSLSISHDHWGRPVLVVAQHGGNYTTIDHRGNTKFRQMGVAEPVPQTNAMHERNAPTLIRHMARAPFGPNGSPQDPILLAMVGLDGSVKLQEESSKMLWEKSVSNQLFALCTLDVTLDGRKELVACAWDGTTFIYDQEGHCVEFVFEERVSAFTAGIYSVSKGNPQPCLFFLTFSDRLYIYFNLSLKTIPTTSLISRLNAQFELSKNAKIDKSGPWTRAEQARLVKSILDPSKFDENAALAYKAQLEKRLQESMMAGE